MQHLAPHRRYLFLDPAFAAAKRHCALHVNPPIRSEVVMRPDRPWERAMLGFYSSVLQEQGRLRMWYHCRDRSGLYIGYAESTDGLTWHKPELGLVRYHDSRANNLVNLPTCEGTVFRDPTPESPNARYVYVASICTEGIVRFHSPDGLNWRRDARPLLPFRADTQNVVFRDPRCGNYVLYLRGWDVDQSWEGRLRKVVRLTLGTLAEPAAIRSSGRGVNPRRADDRPRIVEEMPTVLAVDELDPLDTDIYTIAAQPYPLDPGWYVSFPAYYRHFPGGAVVNDGVTEVQFAGSADGIRWHRYDRPPYIPRGLAGSDSGGMVYMGTGLVVCGDEIWQYGVGFRTAHGQVEERKRTGDGTIYRHVHRLDGFVSLDFGSDAGECVTAPVPVDGPVLYLNVDAGALGTVQVELQDPSGQVIAGHGLDQCLPVRTNGTAVSVAWEAGGDLAPLLGRTVRLRIRGVRSKVYALYFTAASAKGSETT